MFSVNPQQVPYVLQAWADRNGTTPDQWMVQDIDSGQEIPSTRPGGNNTSNGYYIIRGMDHNDKVSAFTADNDQEAIEVLDFYRHMHPGEEYNVIPAAASRSQNNGVQDIPIDVAQNFPDTTWEIYRLSNPSVVYHTITAPYQVAAIRQASTLLARNGLDSSEFDIRPAAVPGSTQDLQQQRANPGSFTGAWRVLDTAGREVWRFRGVGNVQADANRVAIDWLQDNGHDPAEYSVLPIVS